MDCQWDQQKKTHALVIHSSRRAYRTVCLSRGATDDDVDRTRPELTDDGVLRPRSLVIVRQRDDREMSLVNRDWEAGVGRPREDITKDLWFDCRPYSFFVLHV